jgi:hypothetical protein
VVVPRGGLLRANGLKELECQPALTAPIEGKGISGALANPDNAIDIISDFHKLRSLPPSARVAIERERAEGDA